MKALSGRMNRATYWAGLAVVTVIIAIIINLDTEAHMPGEIALIFLGVPRLHDLERSGWWVLLLIAVEIVGLIAVLAFNPFGDPLVVVGIVGLVIALLMILLGLIPGQPDANRFGPPPPRGLGLRKQTGTSPEDVF